MSQYISAKENYVMISIEEMQGMLDELAEEFPQEFYKDLNGGIVLLSESKQHEKSVGNDLYILGEYYNDRGLGRYIAVYYGSFSFIYGNLSKDNIIKRLRKILRHEFTHHLESLAGERGLEYKDAKDISDYLKRWKRPK